MYIIHCIVMIEGSHYEKHTCMPMNYTSGYPLGDSTYLSVMFTFSHDNK